MTCEPTPLDSWDPAPLAEVARLFHGLTTPWWVAGGRAMELAAGRRIRDHGDTDVLMLRRDQSAVQRALPGLAVVGRGSAREAAAVDRRRGTPRARARHLVPAWPG